ncbi:MAG: hypothetical protein ABIH25_00390 [Candidatus Woesearchaeota archaeon]
MKIEQKLKSLKQTFGAPIAVAMIVDDKGITIRKVRQVEPHFLANKGKKAKIEEFDEVDLDDVAGEVVPFEEETKKELNKRKSYLG